MNNILTWLPVAISAVIFLGAATVYLRGSRDKGTIDSLERSNNALLEEQQIQAKKIQDLQGEVQSLREANTVLRDVIGAKDEVAALHTALDSHHAAAMAGMTQIHEDLDGIATGIAAAITGGSK